MLYGAHALVGSDRSSKCGLSTKFASATAANRDQCALPDVEILVRPIRAVAIARRLVSASDNASRLTHVKVRRLESAMDAILSIIGYVSDRTRDNRR